jgi:uncharacterized protein (DUF305 family)
MKKVLSLLSIAICLSIVPLSIASAHEKEAAMESSPQAQQQPYDVQFLDTMAKHHKDGIKMFQMGADKAQNQELKAMAQKMVDDQKKEIPELKALREKIKPGAPEAVNMKLMNMSDMDMSMLEEKSGMDFDREFLSMTIKHHQAAVDMSDVALKKAQSAEVKGKAQMMHDMQKEEISRMEKMLNDMKKS